MTWLRWYLFRFSIKRDKKDHQLWHAPRKNIKKSEKALSQADFPKNPVISFSVLRAKKDSHPFGWLAFFICDGRIDTLISPGYEHGERSLLGERPDRRRWRSQGRGASGRGRRGTQAHRRQEHSPGIPTEEIRRTNFCKCPSQRQQIESCRPTIKTTAFAVVFFVSMTFYSEREHIKFHLTPILTPTPCQGWCYFRIGTLSVSEVMTLWQISGNPYYKYKRELKTTA